MATTAVSDTAKYFVAFPRNSVTLISSPTYSGKTFLVQHIIKNSRYYFAQPLTRVVIILCNPRVSFDFEQDPENPPIEVVTCSLQDFNDDIIQTQDLVLVEDIQFLTEEIKTITNVLCHHLDLIGVILISQGLLGQPKLFPLLSLSHRIVLFLSNSASIRLSKFILQSCYQDAELKQYLKNIISYAEREKSVLLLELNPVSGPQQPCYIAISNLANFPPASMPRPIVFPHPSKKRLYMEEFQDNSAELSGLGDDLEALPEGSYILVPSSQVTRKKKGAVAGAEDDCEAHWNELMDVIHDNLENNFTGKKLILAKNLVREMLSTKQFCISASGKRIMIKDSPKHKVSLIDFVTNVLRRSAPSETLDEKLLAYIPFVKILLQNDAPTHYFKNKLLLQSIHSKRKKQSPIKRGQFQLKQNSMVKQVE